MSLFSAIGPCVLLGFTVAATVMIPFVLVIGILHFGSYLSSVIGEGPAICVALFLIIAVVTTSVALIVRF